MTTSLNISRLSQTRQSNKPIAAKEATLPKEPKIPSQAVLMLEKKDTNLTVLREEGGTPAIKVVNYKTATVSKRENPLSEELIQPSIEKVDLYFYLQLALTTSSALVSLSLAARNPSSLTDMMLVMAGGQAFIGEWLLELGKRRPIPERLQ
ncbi:hypothetical protein QYF36_012845 [Acer negundo]|nr:hypothetical protein QYF36_012845 [Acer negundo]